jgi:small multidrug resistance family-3 protein
VWVAIRGQGGKDHRKPWWYAVLGSLLLVAYGFIPCLQPTDSFGRIYAVYGGFFIVLSFLFGWALDGDKPDLGDAIGGAVALAGVCLIMFWPRP